MATLHRNDSLNPALWDGDRLKSDVRTALLNFAEAWRKYARIPREAVLDVLLVGGNASLYYNEASDIDVHLLVDPKMLPGGDMADEFLRDRKALWTARYNVHIKGYPVEPYAQPTTEKFPAGQGVYSLTRAAWVQRPTTSSYDPSKDPKLAKKVEAWRDAIDHAIHDEGEEDVDALRNKLAEMRARAIRTGGELSRNNLVFKALRLSGHIDAMKSFIRRQEASRLSLS